MSAKEAEGYVLAALPGSIPSISQRTGLLESTVAIVLKDLTSRGVLVRDRAPGAQRSSWNDLFRKPG